MRAYLTVSDGLDVPDYLKSKSTFALGGFGGHGGRALRTGDVLRLKRDRRCLVQPSFSGTESFIPKYTDRWELGVLYGPHGAPDFFTEDDIDTFFAAEWKVHYNSNRTGVRLVGPKPKWARRDGGEAGLHPSNIHDNAYAIGAVDFPGDMPILLGPDGPSLGGFVCPVTLVKSELWKLGQLRANNRVRFRRLSAHEALQAELAQEEMIATLRRPLASSAHSPPARGPASRGTPPQRRVEAATPSLASIPPRATRPAVDRRPTGAHPH